MKLPLRPAAPVRDAQPVALLALREILHDLDGLIAAAAAGNGRVTDSRYVIRFAGGHEHPHDPCGILCSLMQVMEQQEEKTRCRTSLQC